MILPLQNFTTLVQNMSAGLQGGAAQLIDLSVGSVLRALLEACASVALWMQWLIVQVLTMTRAATSVGPDLDSWMADFSLARLPGDASSGNATFYRYTPGQSTTIAVGTIVKTLDGLLSFSVQEDITNSAWNGMSGYLLPSAASSISLPIQALVQGAAGNVLAGAIGLLGTATPGVDGVTNPLALTGGVDAEPDAALRARFQLYINSRSLGTSSAVGAAIQAIQQGLRYSVQENVDQSGNSLPGHFCVVVDDGTGQASSDLIAEASAAVEAVRPIGTTYSVAGPVVVQVNIVMALVTSGGPTVPTIAARVQQALTTWIASLPMAGTLAISKLEAIAHDVDAAVVSVESLLVNGLSSDIVAPIGGVIEGSSISVSVN